MKFALPTLTPEMRETLVEKGLYLVAGIIILVLAHHIGSTIKRAIYHKGQSDLKDIKATSESNQTKQIRKTRLLFIILGQIAYYGILGFAILLVLKLLGIEATSIIALLGATGFTIGLALQGTFSDISSGILLGFIQTYTIGDLIEVDGVKGRVRDFNLTRTILEDVDTNAMIMIPNRLISENKVTNHTRNTTRRVKFDIKVGNTYSEFAKLIKLLRAELTNYPGVLEGPIPPIVGVSDMGDVGTLVTVKFYIDTKNYPGIVLPIQSHIRQFLADLKVPLVDPF